MATIVDVAQAANVSVATVSRVLNGKSQVREALRERVLSAVEALRYVPNPTARNLRRNESRTILILAPNLTNPYYTHIIAGIGEAAHEHGYSSFLCNTEGVKAREELLLGRLSLHQADGAILLATELHAQWLEPYAQRHPIVQSSEFDPDVDIVHVSVDSYQAARDVMNHLLNLGHKRIALISSENRYYSTAMRLKGYLDALADAGLPATPEYIRKATVDYTFKSGFNSARSLLSQEARPTALFCISDMLALGAIAGAQEMGFRVPEDVTVVGFDDVEHTTMFHPYVTTVAQPCFDIGRRAMELLYELMNGRETPRQVVLPHSLMVRESSAARHCGFMDFPVCV
ncbi:MAG: LacI family DNA-binding transcriptional regulator [Clostridia bacterium]